MAVGKLVNKAAAPVVEEVVSQFTKRLFRGAKIPPKTQKIVGNLNKIDQKTILSSIRKEPEIAEGWKNMFINAGSDDMEVKLSAFEELNQSLTRFRGEAKLQQKENRIDDMFYTDSKNTAPPDLSWVGDRKSSKLNQAGMRRNVMQYGYYQRQLDPDIPPSEISQGFKEEMGTMSYDGVPQKVLSGGSQPTKKTEISEAGQRKLQVQAVAENQARKDRGVVKRKRHKSTSNYTKMKSEAAKENSQALKAAKAQGMRTTKGQQFVSVEHDVAITHASKWWDKVGYIGNEADNIFIQRNQLARQFKDNIENWFYPKSKDFVIKSDRSNLKDLIIVDIETGDTVLRIPMPDNFKTGIPDNIRQQLKRLLNK